MKKTLIAMTVAASAVVSGSAMAGSWVSSGTGGTFEMSGTLSPETGNPWEVYVGDAVSGLDAVATTGQSEFDITISQPVPVLGIRVADASKTFSAPALVDGSGLNPQIDFNGAVDTGAFSSGVSTLTLELTDATGQRIGEMTAPFTAVAASSYSNGSASNAYSLYSSSNSYAFFGGLGTKASSAVSNPVSVAEQIDPSFTANFENFGNSFDTTFYPVSFNAYGVNVLYSGFYGSGIQNGSVIKITLDSPVSGTSAIQWKASLPVTVTYA
ncbi:TPA: hypothetical protein JZG64_004595 [Escherichia coli]|nr:hypothetical protein [Escherichia coli]HAX5186451.1 hypothetical protein [Escherichia coli]HAX5233320.1 hypothetical protein [Escherichia coli]